MKATILTSLLLVGFVSASSLTDTIDQFLSDSRVIRAVSSGQTKEVQPDKIKDFKCAAGEYAVQDEVDGRGRLTCTQCEEGSYTSRPGLWIACMPCNKGQLPGDRSKCIAECKEGKGYNRTSSRCEPCELGFYSDDISLNPCKRCGQYTNTSKKGAKSCDLRCPVGFEATADEQSCQSCTFGTYNPGSKGKRQKPCTSCCGKNNPDCRKRWTLNTGAKAKDECIAIPKRAEECFTALTNALKGATEHLARKSDLTLRQALCKADPLINWAELHKNYTKCKDIYVNNDEGAGKRLVPSHKASEDRFLNLEVLFASGNLPKCSPTGSEDAGSGGSGSGSGSGSGRPGSGSGSGSGRPGSGSGSGSGRPGSGSGSGSGRPGSGSGSGSGRPGSGSGSGSGRPGSGSGSGSGRPGSGSGSGSGRPSSGSGSGSGRPGSGSGSGSGRSGSGSGSGSGRPGSGSGSGSGRPSSGSGSGSGRPGSGSGSGSGRPGSGSGSGSGRPGSGSGTGSGRPGSGSGSGSGRPGSGSGSGSGRPGSGSGSGSGRPGSGSGSGSGRPGSGSGSGSGLPGSGSGSGSAGSGSGSGSGSGGSGGPRRN